MISTVWISELYEEEGESFDSLLKSLRLVFFINILYYYYFDHLGE